MSHGDRIEALPAGFDLVGESANCPAAAVAAPARKFWGVQFHPEVVHTPRGGEILANFLFRICGCTPNWTMAGFVDEAVAAVAARVGPNARAVCGLSGGVDSSVAAALVLKAIGDAPDLHLRRHRPPARERGGPGRGAVSRRLQGRSARRRRRASGS